MANDGGILSFGSQALLAPRRVMEQWLVIVTTPGSSMERTRNLGSKEYLGGMQGQCYLLHAYGTVAAANTFYSTIQLAAMDLKHSGIALMERR